jgi:hypothetical protein
LKCLTCFQGVRTEIYDELKDIPDEVIIRLNKRNPQVFDPYRLNIITGKLALLAENPGNVIGWITDHKGKLRASYAIIDGVNQTILFRNTECDTFRNVLTTSWRETCNPFFFTFDNQQLYVSSNLGRDKQEIAILDFETKKEDTVLYKNSDVDVDQLYFSQKRKVLTYAEYTTDKTNYYFFDEETKKMFEDLQSQLPDYEISIAASTKDED